MNEQVEKQYRITYSSYGFGFIQDPDGEIVIEAPDEETAREDFYRFFGHPDLSYAIEEIEEVTDSQ